MHTPAPWEVLIITGDIFIAPVGDDFGGNTIAQIIVVDKRDISKANAQLIAAAPDLLDALQLLQNAFIHKEGNTKGNQAKTDIITLNPEVGEALNTARETIQKATGGT